MCSLTICSNIASPGLLLEHAYWLEIKLQIASLLQAHIPSALLASAHPHCVLR